MIQASGNASAPIRCRDRTAGLVGGNPETLTDPSGHELACQAWGCGAFGSSASETAPAAGSGVSEAVLGVLEDALGETVDLGVDALALPILVGAVIFQMATPQPLSTAGSMSTPSGTWSASSGTAPAPPLPPLPGITTTGGINRTATSGGMPIAAPLPTTLSTPMQSPLPISMVNLGISLNIPNWVMKGYGKSIRYVSEDYLKKILKEMYGTDPHAVKEDFLGRGAKIASWDFYVDSNGELWLYRKGTQGEEIDTGYNIKNANP